MNETKFHDQLRHELWNIYQTDHILAIDYMRTTFFCKPPWILRPSD